MLTLLSPSKTLDFETVPTTAIHTQPEFLAESETLIRLLRKYTPAKLAELMDISANLAALNVQRYHDFTTPFTTNNARQALLAFKGDVYQGMDVAYYKREDFAFAQKHVRMLSGLYGLLRPLDLIQPYRLEMGIRLKNTSGQDLYSFWGERLTQAINQVVDKQPSKWVINLASQEYFKAVHASALNAKLLTVDFKDRQKDGSYKTLGLFAKKARGLMTDAIIRNRWDKPEALQDFTGGGYVFDGADSTAEYYLFKRHKPK